MPWTELDLQTYPEPVRVPIGRCSVPSTAVQDLFCSAQSVSETKGVSESVTAVNGEGTNVAERCLCPPSSFVGCSGPLMDAAQELI